MLVYAAEKMGHQEYDDIQMEILTTDTIDDATKDIFTEFEESSPEEVEEPQISSPQILDVHQKAEVEVNDYLREAKLNRKEDPFIYWTGNNAIKWPLLTKLASKLHSAPPTSAESERLFSTAGLIVNDLRKRLTPEHVEKLLFLNHNLNIYNFG